MKTTIRNVLSTSALTLVFASSAFASSASYKAGTYQLDPMHSKLGFEIPHLVISTVEGALTKSEGSVELNEKFEKSKVKASVEVNSINTGVEKRDEHLKSADFFDANKYPKMTFESASISGSPDAFKLIGDLTIKGKKKRVTFDAKYLGTVVDGFGNKKVAFSAKTKISRKDFGLTWNNVVEAGPVVGDEVTLDLRIQAGRPKAQEAKK